MNAVSHYTISNEFAPGLSKRGGIAALLQPRFCKTNTGMGHVIASLSEEEAALRTFLGRHGVSVPANSARSGSATSEKIRAAVGVLMEHGAVAQGIRHACQSGEKLAFKAMMDLVRAGAVDPDASPVEGQPLLALVSAVKVDSDADQQRFRKSYAVDERIEMLADLNANFGVRDVHGNSFLHLAAKYDADTEVVHALAHYAGKTLKASDVNMYGETALHVGVREGCSARMVRTLFSLGVDLAAQDAAGRTALHLAAAHTLSPDVVEALLNNGANLDAVCDQERSALHYAAAYSNHPDIIALLVKRGADARATDNEGNTPLSLYAARHLTWPAATQLEQ